MLGLSGQAARLAEGAGISVVFKIIVHCCLLFMSNGHARNERLYPHRVGEQLWLPATGQQDIRCRNNLDCTDGALGAWSASP